MTQIFITNLTINKVRHLENISIPLAEEQMKHLILTGKNGSGKTSVVEAMAGHINSAFTDEYFQDKTEWLNYAKKAKDQAIETGEEKTIFADETLRLIFDEETFEFHIVQ